MPLWFQYVNRNCLLSMQPRVATLRPGARKDPSASQVILLSQRKRNRISQETNLRGLWHGAQEGEHGQRYFDPGGFRDSGGRSPGYPDLQIEEESTQVISNSASPFDPHLRERGYWARTLAALHEFVNEVGGSFPDRAPLQLGNYRVPDPDDCKDIVNSVSEVKCQQKREQRNAEAQQD
jgi:hypothetical protein